MKKVIITILIQFSFFFFHNSFTQILHVPDDYPTIQAGIDAANNGDTVLVEPGIYFENICIGHDDNMGYKRITVASHYLINNDRSFIYNTIIDGNQSGSTVCFRWTDLDSLQQVLCGFVIQNGSGGAFGEEPQPTRGGGIRNEGEENIVLRNLIVQNNDGGDYGGGIWCGWNDTIYLKDVTVRNNKAAHGGGIVGHAIFDPSELCSVYSNYAIVGADFFGTFSSLEIQLDTFSVKNPTGFYASPIDNYNFQVNTGLVEQVNADLFVSPDGNNDNSGLNEQSPLKNISVAFSRLYVDSMNAHTVYLLDGIYNAENNNKFPVCIPQYTHLIGNNKNDVILDGGGESGINPDFEDYNSVIIFKGNSNTQLSGVTITGGMGTDLDFFILGGGILCYRNSNPVMQDIIITGNEAYFGGGLCIMGNDQSQGGPIIEHALIKGNNAFFGGGIAMTNSEPAIINSVVDSNYVSTINGYGVPCGGGVYCTASNPRFINSTIVNNMVVNGSEGGGIYLESTTSLEIINSILWNNQPQEVLSKYGSSIVSISYSNLEDGIDGIVSNSTNDTIIWLEGNIDQDPLFLGSGDHPYLLHEDSPCIDQGNPDTTGLSIGFYDLLGNYRLWDGDLDGDTIVDMGACEFGALPYEVSPEFVIKDYDMRIFPNPCEKDASMRFTLNNTAATQIDLFSFSGQIMCLLNEKKVPGDYELEIDLTDLSAGVYFCTLKTDEGIQTKKIIKL